MTHPVPFIRLLAAPRARAPLHLTLLAALATLPTLHAQAQTPAPTQTQATSPAQTQPVPTLRENVVSVTRFAEPAQPLPLGVSVLTADDIRSAGANTVAEALIRLLGVPGRQDFYGGGEYSLDLRGFGSTADLNQLVVLDGQRLSEADLGGTRLAAIAVDTIERIEVLRGSGAVLYGEGATGGVIVITTKAGAGVERTSGASVYLGAGSFNTRDARASATLASGGFSADLHAQRRSSDNHRDNFRSEQGAASLGLQWAGEGLRLGATLAHDDLDTRLPGGISRAQFDANPRQSNNPSDFATLRNTRFNLFARADLGAWQLAAEAGTRDRTLRSQTVFLGSVTNYDYDIAAHTQSLRARHEGSFAGLKNSFVVGTDHAQWQRDVLGPFGGGAEQRTQALYFKDDLTLSGGTRLSAGWRSERIKKAENISGTRLDGRVNAWELGASQPLGGGVTVYARTGRSFRLASVDEFSFSNPGALLRPQTSRDSELGVRWAAGTASVDARIYRSDLQDEIGFDPAATGPFGPFGANVNFDATRREGLELDGALRITRELSLRASAALRSATFRAGTYAGRDVPLVPRRTLALRADFVPTPGHRLSGGVVWVAAHSVDFGNSCSVPSYATLDARYAWQMNKQTELSLGINNLLDRKYFSQAFACAGAQATSVYPEAGRSLTAAARIGF